MLIVALKAARNGDEITRPRMWKESGRWDVIPCFMIWGSFLAGAQAVGAQMNIAQITVLNFSGAHGRVLPNRSQAARSDNERPS